MFKNHMPCRLAPWDAADRRRPPRVPEPTRLLALRLRVDVPPRHRRVRLRGRGGRGRGCQGEGGADGNGIEGGNGIVGGDEGYPDEVDLGNGQQQQAQQQQSHRGRGGYDNRIVISPEIRV